MKIIAISGKAGSGKDVFAQLLAKHLGNCTTLAFAEEVKRVAYELGWDGKKDIKGRALLQSIGDVARRYNENYWGEMACCSIKAKAIEFKGQYTIITDCRFQNEIEELRRNFDVTTIRLERFGYDNGLTPHQKMHESETALDTYEFDYVIHNNDTLEALEREAEYIAVHLED